MFWKFSRIQIWKDGQHETSRGKEEAKGCLFILLLTSLNAQGNTAGGTLKDFLLPSPFWHLEHGSPLLPPS